MIPTIFISVIQFMRMGISEKTETIPLAFWEILSNQLKHPITTAISIASEPQIRSTTLILIGVLLLLLWLRFWDMWKRFRQHKVEDASDYGAYDTSKWAEGKDVVKSDDFITDIKDDKKFGSLIGKTLDTKEFIIRKSDSSINAHTFGLAGSGRGKTTGYILNQIVLNKHKTTISTDGKGELYRLTSKLKAAEGFKILYIDFVKFLGDRWNPLSQLNFDEIDNFSTNLVESADDDSKNVWGSNAINLISACIAYVFEVEAKENQNMVTVRQLINLSEEDIKQAFEDLPDDSIAKDYFSEVSESKDKVWDGIVTTTKSATRFWKQKRIRNFTEVSDFSFTDLGTEKIAMYIRIHPTDKTYEVLVNTFFKQMFNTLIEEVDQFGGRYPVEINFDLDEFTNAGKIPSFQGILSFVRALGLNISLFVQDIAQMNLVYGEEDTKSIVANCDNFVFLGTNESSTTAPFIEKKLGETTKILRDNTGKAKDTDYKDDSLKYTYFKRSLMSVSEILKLPKALGVYFHSGCDPLLFAKTYSYELFPELEDAPFAWHIEKESRENEKRSTSSISQTVSTKKTDLEDLSNDQELEIFEENDNDFLPY